MEDVDLQYYTHAMFSVINPTTMEYNTQVTRWPPSECFIVMAMPSKPLETTVRECNNDINHRLNENNIVTLS